MKLNKTARTLAVSAVLLITSAVTAPAPAAIRPHLSAWNQAPQPAKPEPAKPQPTKPQSASPAAEDPAPTAGLTPDEQQILTLVNQARAKAGAPALTADPQLVRLARLKSQDMVAKNYFSHQSPTYGSPFDMLRRNGVTFRTAGENIAGNPSVSGAFQAWMNSPGHRANILNPRFTKTGIGIAKGSRYGNIFTQLFTG